MLTRCNEDVILRPFGRDGKFSLRMTVTAVTAVVSPQLVLRPLGTSFEMYIEPGRALKLA
jgi:hypothetical protein